MNPQPAAGEIWFVDFGKPQRGEPALQRPAFVVAARRSGHVFLVPITRRQREINTHIEIEAGESTGLRVPSYAQCEHCKSVQSTRLIRRLGEASLDIDWRIRETLRTLMNL